MMTPSLVNSRLDVTLSAFTLPIVIIVLLFEACWRVIAWPCRACQRWLTGSPPHPSLW